MKRIGLLAVGATVIISLWTGGIARSELCTIDAVPAATLLLPYFAVDIDRSRAPDTVISINNMSAAPAAAQVSLWTAESQPAISFIVPLTGYDVDTISLRDLFNGILPPGVDPDCVVPTASILKKRKNKRGRARQHTRLVEKFTKGAGRAVARGYITIDNVGDETCATIFPNESGYFENGGTGIATNDNQLYGQVYIVSNKQIAAHNLVSIEASDSTTSDGTYTFYGRYSDFDGSDNREPLANDWAARFINTGRAKTYLQVWRDSGPFSLPLPQTQVIFFDEQENPFEVDGEDFFPLETQEVQIGRDLPSPYASGWIYLNLNGEDTLQAYVTVRQDFRKRSSLFDAMTYYDTASGDTSATVCGRAPTASQ